MERRYGGIGKASRRQGLSYFGSKASEENPEEIMTGVTRALLSEYEANSYAA